MATPDKRQSTASVVLTREVTVEISVPDKALTPTVGVYAVPTNATSVTSITSNPTSDKTTTNPFDADIEALNSHSSFDKPLRKSMTLDAKKNCQVWPGKDHWEKQAQQTKVKRNNCACMANLSPRNKIIAKVLIIVLVVGVAVSVGFGISKPLGAPLWGDKSN
ncbi:hypothetical protein TsFJ059_001926 [Trichoderma semiorbis]|uniref:Uncharacterized protein n=2 Tax=Trichoderma TaxID=5543 RepID=A0A9P8HTA8_9HYPO|nr:hypothetical protein TsFJ059_001926 [Trichoderma semiorbis]OPB37593.1 hypothetical protein A0O28_0045050 [Trichoderma guizhouense]